MSDKPETIADIANILRIRAANISDGGAMADGAELRDMADRIEAAAEREREAYCDLCKEKDATIDRLLVERDKAIKECAPGNAAALREALVSARTYLQRVDHLPNDTMRRLFESAWTDVNAALAAPARNCDRFADIATAIATFSREVPDWEDHDGIPDYYELAKWLFAPAEGGVK